MEEPDINFLLENSALKDDSKLSISFENFYMKNNPHYRVKKSALKQEIKALGDLLIALRDNNETKALGIIQKECQNQDFLKQQMPIKVLILNQNYPLASILHEKGFPVSPTILPNAITEKNKDLISNMIKYHLYSRESVTAIC